MILKSPLRQIFLCLVSLLIFSHCQKSASQDMGKKADVIIYGGTAAGVIAAVQVIRSGKSVILISPSKNLGGMTSGGLGFTDTGNKEVIGGLTREFYQRIYSHYDLTENWKWQLKSEYGNKGQGTPAIDGDKRTMWIFEPHAAENVFEDFIRENKIEVIREEWLNRDLPIEKQGNTIQAFTSLSGQKYEGKIFIDATYEGDLMAAAGVPYHIGRESNATYGENWNGIQVGVLHHDHYFKTDISPYVIPGDPSSGLLPRISTADPGLKGEGDDRIQAYCFRMCLSNHPENRIPFVKPENYDRNQYALLSRVFEAGWDELFRKFDPIPNRKTDTNNHGPFSTDNIGMNYDYPNASYNRRTEILAEHESYQKGLMYFLANDSTVPPNIREEVNQWGLAKDEFVDNGNWPHQIYVREARRMLGEFVMTENEIMGRQPVSRSVGMGSYGMDSHNIQRYIKPDGFVQNEGDIGVSPPRPYQIDYGSLIPKKGSVDNLLVPVCLASSHIAYGSIRMEPVFMILGQSAAIAASQAIDKKTPVQDLDYEMLRQDLLKAGQMLEYRDVK
ncbi:MAG: FAD-dependent oxidoreductase [Saprospiraceae bacterium]|nr:FAD-dependent oxidoreductase [Saprospiraceae bacterium]